ncbi:MAG: nitroreductase [Deltaproteobacteria bacterium HGW-Deltaproteobacteria-6]|nr:MAG: nitroreductase [Deltaproteobacteria bacterium HGW-Deltaproteobacteria-6]
MTSITEIIQKRYSCRSYSADQVEESVLQSFRQTVSAPQKGPFGNSPRFVLISMDTFSRDDWKKLGTYGVIKNAHLYLAGMISPAPMATQDYGYCKEKLILKATELGLSTCWMGGTFAISAFGRAAGMRRNELLPTVTPIGYAAKRRSLTERVMRGIAGSDHRQPWSALFFNGSVANPLSPEDAGTYREALENVRLAPSASNKQPWRIVYEPARNTFLFYLSRAFGYRHMRDVSLQEIDIGIAMCHFDLTLKESGLAGSWRQDDSAPSIKSLEYMASWQAGS